jgi:hypothetical protein
MAVRHIGHSIVVAPDGGDAWLAAKQLVQSQSPVRHSDIGGSTRHGVDWLAPERATLEMQFDLFGGRKCGAVAAERRTLLRRNTNVAIRSPAETQQ